MTFKIGDRIKVTDKDSGYYGEFGVIRNVPDNESEYYYQVMLNGWSGPAYLNADEMVIETPDIKQKVDFDSEFLALVEGRKIPFIKLIRHATGMGLQESKDLCDKLVAAAEFDEEVAAAQRQIKHQLASLTDEQKEQVLDFFR